MWRILTPFAVALLLTFGAARSHAQSVTPEPVPDSAVMSPAEAAVIEARDTTLEDWLWLKRPVVVFADSPLDPRYIEQMELLSSRLEALLLRDVIVITDTDPRAESAVRRKLRPRGFMLAVLAKDGTIVIRKPGPWSVREISRSIDKLPLRQQELRAARDMGS